MSMAMATVDDAPIAAEIPLQKMKFSIKDFFSKCDQIGSFINGKLHFLCSIYITSIFSLICINAVVLLIQEMIF